MVESWSRWGSWAGPGPQVLGPCRLTHAEVAPAEGTERAGAGVGWRVSLDGLCERAEAGAGVDGGALCCAACPLAFALVSQTLARALRLFVFHGSRRN